MEKAKILLIEDEPAVREVLSDLLSLEGYEVCSAANGELAIETLKELLPDVIICDIKMPKMDGYEFLRRLRKDARIADIPFVFLSAKVDPIDVRSGMNLGADDYLLKPVRKDVLVEAIEARINRSRQQKLMADARRALKFQRIYDCSEEEVQEQVGRLSKSELTILKLIAKGLTSGEVANKLFITEKTVENHRYNIARKLSVSGAHSVLSFALKAKPYLD